VREVRKGVAMSDRARERLIADLRSAIGRYSLLDVGAEVSDPEREKLLKRIDDAVQTCCTYGCADCDFLSEIHTYIAGESIAKSPSQDRPEQEKRRERFAQLLAAFYREGKLTDDERGEIFSFAEYWVRAAESVAKSEEPLPEQVRKDIATVTRFVGKALGDDNACDAADRLDDFIAAAQPRACR
jgi:hypothetical protein